MPPKGKKKAETETPTEAAAPPPRRSSRLAPGAAAANAAPVEEAPPSAAAAAAAAASAAPKSSKGTSEKKEKKGKKKAAATEEDVIVLLTPRVRELVPEDIEDDDIQGALHDVLMGLPQPVDYDALQGLEEELSGIVFQAVDILTGGPGAAGEGEGKVDQEEAPPAAADAAASSPPAAAATPLGAPAPGPFSASAMAAQAAQAAAASASPAFAASANGPSPAASPAAPLRIVAPAPDMNALLAAAQAARASRAAPAAAAAAAEADEDGEEDSLPPPAAAAAAPSSAASAAAAAAAAAAEASQGAKAMSQSPFSVAATPIDMAASPLVQRGVFNPAHLSLRITAVKSGKFSEGLGERTNALYPTLGMAPVPWSVLKTAAAAYGETYFTFTLAEDSPSSDYNLETGDPAKVAVAGVFNVYNHGGRVVIRMMDMGCRPELVPKAGGINLWISYSVRSIMGWVVGRVGATPVFYRHQRKQLMKDNEFVSLLNTYASLGIGIGQYTHAAPGHLPTALRTKGMSAGSNALPITNQFANPGVEGPDYTSYETRAKGSGAVTIIRTSEIATVRERDPIHGDEDAPSLEFLANVAFVLSKPSAAANAGAAAAAAGPVQVTVPDPIVLEDPQSESVFSNPALKLPRRGGRKTTRRKRKTSSRQ